MTTDNRRHQIESLYHALAALPAHERAAALIAASPDDEAMRADVESLFTQRDSTFGPLVPAGLAASVEARPDPARVAGMRIGSFEIQALLGSGGMGEVYRARDTRLGRDVAIKLLPRAFTQDPDRVARFGREARVLASLNHPHIGAVYGLEEGDGISALVMELVEGDDLSQRLAGGPLPIPEALRIARQIAEALEAAHEQGIVHRDLKPANIRVRRDGTVKVLDFGLAKALAADTDQASTLTGIRTQPGRVLGTPAYMSPEQARGEAADRQADIWSFGVVLYQLLTGASPFLRTSVTETLAAVLDARVDFTRLPSATPAPVRHVLRRCLQIDRKRRLHHIGDARIDLEEAGVDRGSDVTPDQVPAAVRGSRWSVIAAALALALVGGIAGWLIAHALTGQRAPTVVRLSIPSMEPAFAGPYGQRHLAVSPDGSRVAYVSATALWIRDIRQGRPLRVPINEGANPFFSRDGNWVGFFGRQGGETLLLKVSARGGTPAPISVVPDRPAGATWRADGSIVFAASGDLYQVSGTGGEPHRLTTRESRQDRAYAWPEFLPDGGSVLFTIVADASQGAQIALLDLNTGEVRSVLRDGSSARYVPTGHLVYASGAALKVVAFDARMRATNGAQATVADVAIATAPDNGASDFAVSPTGTLVFLAPNAGSESQTMVTWVNRAGQEEPLALAPGRYGYARISPDGTRVALDIPGANRDIWIWDVKRSVLSKLTNGPTEDTQPVWSSDGGRVYFSSNRTGNFDLYSQFADGATDARLELAAEGTQHPSSITADGTALLICENYKDISVLRLGRPNRLEPLLHSDASEWLSAVSPDGKWIAYESNESGDRIDIIVRPFPNVTAGREKISINGGRHPKWRPNDRRELYYIDLEGHMMAASIQVSPTLEVGAVTKLFDWLRPSQGISGSIYDVSPVDGRFLMVKPISNGATHTDISVVLNWAEELKTLLP